MTTQNPTEDARRALHGAWVMGEGSEAARAAAAMGFDYVCIDLQHGYSTLAKVQTMSDAVRAHGDAQVFVRPLDNQPELLGRLADAGVDGIILPMISGADEVRAAMNALRYPDEGGTRSWGPTQRTALGEARRAGREIPQLFIMIETKSAFDELEEICRIDGIGGTYIGPADLAYALGGTPAAPPGWHEEAIDHVRRVTQQNNLPAGVHTTNREDARRRAAQKFDVITVSTDLVALRTALERDLDNARTLGSAQ